MCDVKKFNELAKSYWDMKKTIKFYEIMAEGLLKDLRALTNDQPFKGDDYEFKIDTRPGAVDYAKIPQLHGVVLEPYRKAPVTVCKLVEVVKLPGILGVIEK